MSLDTDKTDLMQSLLEGVAMRATEVIAAMDALSPVGNSISVDGGVTTNPYFCQFLANALQLAVSVKSDAELTAIGTALLAAGADSTISLTGKLEQVYHPQSIGCDYLEQFTKAMNCAKDWRM